MLLEKFGEVIKFAEKKWATNYCVTTKAKNCSLCSSIVLQRNEWTNRKNHAHCPDTLFALNKCVGQFMYEYNEYLLNANILFNTYMHIILRQHTSLLFETNEQIQSATGKLDNRIKARANNFRITLYSTANGWTTSRTTESFYVQKYSKSSNCSAESVYPVNQPKISLYIFFMSNWLSQVHLEIFKWLELKEKQFWEDADSNNRIVSLPSCQIYSKR